MSTRRKSVRPESQEVYLNDQLPILYVDTCAISSRRDGFNYLSFATNTPNTSKSVVEQVRLIIDDESLRLILDNLCQTLDHFPERPSKRRTPPAK
jgi:hypothetical protein